MKNALKLIISISMLFGLLSSLGSRAYADVNDFVINDFAADYYLTKDDNQGQLHIIEHIDVTFSDFNHGILRAIPDTYKGHSLKPKINSVSSPSGAPSQFSSYNQNDNKVLKIDDANQTVTGHQQYTIDYTLQNVITFYGDHDELYWNINGNQWGQPFTKVTANIHVPDAIKIQDQKCFTGGLNSTRQACVISKVDDGITAATTQKLEPYETLTVVSSLPAGYFAKQTAADWWKDNAGKILGIALPPLVIGGFAFMYWRRKGKDLKGRGIIIPEYGPPDNLGPAEAGIIMSYRLNPKYVSAVIIDLAIRKYLKINEITEKKILKDKKTYEFELVNPDFSVLKSYEQAIMNKLFAAKTADERVTLAALKSTFYVTVQSLQTSLPKDLTDQGYFPSNPKRAGAGMYIGAGALVFLAFSIHMFASIGLAISAAILFMFARLMPSRTAKGVAAEEAIKGLKLYMETAEADRIKMLQSPDAPYATQSDAPVKTVDLFEKLLPYAMVLGVENQWAKQFADIYNTPPDWYNGNWSTFNAIYLTSALTNSVGAMTSNFSPPSSSGSSGFSGDGGFSGGGGGGGGGGGW